MSDPKSGKRFLAWVVLIVGVIFDVAAIFCVFGAIWSMGHGNIVAKLGGSATACVILGVIGTLAGCAWVDSLNRSRR